MANVILFYFFICSIFILFSSQLHFSPTPVIENGFPSRRLGSGSKYTSASNGRRRTFWEPRRCHNYSFATFAFVRCGATVRILPQHLVATYLHLVRLYVRIHVVKAFGQDDLFIIIATVFYSVQHLHLAWKSY
jgi:hypothetical protein